jgi:hypothetical protein
MNGTRSNPREMWGWKLRGVANELGEGRKYEMSVGRVGVRESARGSVGRRPHESERAGGVRKKKEQTSGAPKSMIFLEKFSCLSLYYSSGVPYLLVLRPDVGSQRGR